MVPVAFSVRRWLSGVARDDGGQAVVEFALVVPIFLLLLFGIVEVARACGAYVIVTNLAREGARAAVLADAAITADSIESVIFRGLSAASLDPSVAEVVLSGVDGVSGTASRVEIRYPYRVSILGRLGEEVLPGGAINLVAAVEMRNE